MPINKLIHIGPVHNGLDRPGRCYVTGLELADDEPVAWLRIIERSPVSLAGLKALAALLLDRIAELDAPKKENT